MGIFSRRKPATTEPPILQMRQELLDDKDIFLTIIVNLIKKHRKILESKFEDHLEKDDYGNSFVDVGFKNEVDSFINRVVLPELDRCIRDGKTKYKKNILILCDLMALADKENMPMDISYDDSTQAIVSRLLLATKHKEDDSLITNDMLSQLRIIPTNPEDDMFVEFYSNNIATAAYKDLLNIGILYMDMEIKGLYFGEKIDSHFDVSFFSALVFMIFFVMYDNQTPIIKNEPQPEKAFTGNDPYKYEEYIRDLLREAGFNAKKTRGSGDFGVDVIASKNSKSFAIQCKLYNHTVGAKAVQEVVCGRIYYKTDFAVVVSDNSFTPAAKSLASKSDVILTHHKYLRHKLDELISADIEISSDSEITKPTNNQATQETTAKKQWTAQDADELITVVLPIIKND